MHDFLVLLNLLGQLVYLVPGVWRGGLDALQRVTQDDVLLCGLLGAPGLSGECLVQGVGVLHASVGGNGIVAHVALKLAHVGGQILEMGVKHGDIGQQFLTGRALLLRLAHVLVGHLHALQFQRQLLVAALGGLVGLLLVVDDLLQLLVGDFQLGVLLFEVGQLGQRLLMANGTAALLLLHLFHLFLQPLHGLFVRHQQRHVGLHRANSSQLLCNRYVKLLP